MHQQHLALQRNRPAFCWSNPLVRWHRLQGYVAAIDCSNHLRERRLVRKLTNALWWVTSCAVTGNFINLFALLAITVQNSCFISIFQCRIAVQLTCTYLLWPIATTQQRLSYLREWTHAILCYSSPKPDQRYEQCTQMCTWISGNVPSTNPQRCLRP